ncbi:hypothetical protein FA15DRAFT_324047 [Coprinopsis marcescibilis]|uniref:C2H2-type domain-containing protein n=1 Tax=Coprinopsis marcescibilis TaxID=230819 RepID=A0A5C3KZJ7_COPMA|nr:hypothetical protein FA15DRAFT_324047 [Coprinopsis marcescibilis]
MLTLDPAALTPPQHNYSADCKLEFDQASLSTSFGSDCYAGSWSPQGFSPIPASPSPSSGSIDMSDIKPSISRDPSPLSALRDGAEKADRRRFPCLVLGCNRRFTSQYTLKVHVEAHRPKPRVSFPCTEGCNERFSRQHDRLRHEVAKHGKVCEFLCDDCGRFFSTRKTLGNHKCPVAQGGTRWVTS